MGELIVVVAYNNAYATRQCVDALLAQSHLSRNTRIVVWDNASRDNTQAVLSDLRDKVTVHYSEENLLWTPACNAAVEKYREDRMEAILFMNNDIMLEPNAVDEMCSTLALTNAGATAPWGARLGGMQDQAHWSQRMPGNAPVRASYVVGACVMVATAAWDMVGPLDERMPLGGDDHDYCIRLKHDDWPIMVTRSTFANHLGHASSHTLGGPEAWGEWGGKSWEAFNTKWAGYYATEEEAVQGHWSSEWNPDFPKGTGWDAETYDERVRRGNY